MNALTHSRSSEYTMPVFLLLSIFLSLIACAPEAEPGTEEGPASGPLTNGPDPNYCNTCCTCSSAGAGSTKYQGKTLTAVNFRDQDLTGYDFAGATLLGCRFDDMSLKNVSFQGAAFGAAPDGATCSFSGATLDNVCFVNAAIDSTDFQFTIFKGVDFRCANIFNGKFGLTLDLAASPTPRTNFSYATIGVGEGEYLFPLDQLEPSDWAAADFTYTKFLGLTQDKFHPAGKNLSGAKIAGINLEYFDLSETILIGADLQYARLSYANMDSTICYGANFDGATLKVTSGIDADFYDSSQGACTFNGAALSSAVFDSVDLERAAFSGAILDGIRAWGGNFKNAVFSGSNNLDAASLSEADFSYANFSNASVDQVDFSATKLVGIKFENQSLLIGTNFSGAIMPSASFFNANLQDVSFKGAYLYNVDFSGATLSSTQNGSGVSFECAQLGGANLSATINKANFYNAVIPPDTACCSQKTGVFCGLVPWTGAAYGHTVLPDLKASFRCPDGEVAPCSGDQWVWSPKNESSCATYWNNSAPWTKPVNCNPNDSTDLVVIKDANLKKCLDEQLFKGQDQPISKTLAASVSSIDCCCRSISDLSGLEAFTNLVYLNVEDNDLVDGDFSKYSTQLQTLKVSNNQLTTLLFGSSQYNLTNLEASGNRINQLSGTANIYFQLLDLSNNQLSGDMSKIIIVQTDLVYLDLSDNQLTNVGALGKLAHLASIYLQNNNLTTIGSMYNAYDKGYGSLYNLDLQGNDCFDCNSLGLSASVVQTFNCSCNTATCNNCD